LRQKVRQKKYKQTGAKNKSDYADPKNYKYPIHTEKNVRSALSYFSQSKNYNKYSPSERGSIWSTIKRAAKKYNIKLDPKNDPPWGKKSKTAKLNQEMVDLLAGSGLCINGQDTFNKYLDFLNTLDDNELSVFKFRLQPFSGSSSGESYDTSLN